MSLGGMVTPTFGTAMTISPLMATDVVRIMKVSTMRRARPLAALLAAVALSAPFGACHKRPTPQPVPIPSATPAANSDSARLAQERAERQAAADAESRRRADSLAAANVVSRRSAPVGNMRSTLTAAVHFEYDQSDLRPEDRAILDAKVPILQSNPGITLRIAGHTDERGSDEYNLALGERRAAAAKAYLVQRGISAARLETVSYGEERPVVQGTDESAWSQNRRDEFEIVAGGQGLRQP
jgi:peptidoglycan-associated lipoprotein